MATQITIKQQLRHTITRTTQVEFVSMTTMMETQRDVACFKSDPLQVYIRKVERLARMLNCTEREAEDIILERV